MFKESLTQRKQPSHKLIFDNGHEIDLAQAGLISQARQIQYPQLKSPMKGRNLNISITMASNNRTPVHGIRLKATTTIESGLKRDDSTDDPLQRMVNMVKDHSMGKTGSTNRLGTRNASAHIIDYQLKKKLRLGVDASLGQESIVTSQILLDNKRFSQNLWQAKPSYASLTSAMQGGRASRSVPRGSIVKSNIGFSEQRSQMQMTSLPQIEGSDRNTHFEMQTPFMGIAHQINTDRIIGGDFDSEIVHQGPNPIKQTTAQIIMQAEQSLLKTQLSPLGLASINVSMDQYNTTSLAEIHEEKSEDVQRIIERRQRKAALTSFVRSREKSGHPNMTAYIGRQQLTRKIIDEELELPEISAPARAQLKIKKTDGLDSDEEVGEAIALTKKLKASKLEEKHDSNAKKQEEYKTAPLETKVKTTNDFELETMKRARNRGALKGMQTMETESKQDKIRSPIKAFKNVQMNQNNPTFVIKNLPPSTSIALQPQQSLESLKEVNMLKSTDTAQGFMADTSESIFNEVTQIDATQVDPNKVATEMKNVTDQIMIAPIIKNLQQIGESDSRMLASDQNSKRAFPLSPLAKLDSPLIKLSFGQSVLGRQQTVQFADLDRPNATAGNTVTDSNSQAFSAFRNGQPQPQRSIRSKLSPSERSISSPETNLSSKYAHVARFVNKRTALRIQKVIKSGRKVDLPPEDDYIRKHLEGDQTLVEDDESQDQSETDSSLRFQKQKEEDFNSELDLYSEVQSVTGGFGKQRHSLVKHSTMMLKVIEAEDSAEERGSDTKSHGEGIAKEEDELEVEEEVFEQDTDDRALDERETFRKRLVDEENAKKTDSILCGPRLQKKIEDFAFQVSIEAGLELPNSLPEDNLNDQNFGNLQSRMLQSGNTSMFRIENTKNDDQGQLQKIMDRYIDEFRGQQAFYSMCKRATNESKWTDPNLKNKRVQYFAACRNSNAVAKPILSKIVDKALVLRDLKLNTGDAMGLREALMSDNDLINKLYLDQNGLDGNQLAFIMEGFSHQKQLANLTIQGSTVNENTIQQISTMLKRKGPQQLQELNLIHTKINWRATDELVRSLSQRNYLRKLSLVEAGLNDFSMVNLCSFVRTQKSLTALDISWNQLTSVQMRPLIDILKKNRRITNINLAWNNIMEAKTESGEGPNFKSRQTISSLAKLIKHSNTLTHVNLSGTGLSAPVIYEFGTILRRARAVQVIHLSGNPGLSTENFTYLAKRIKCRDREDIERFTRIQAVVRGVLRSAGCSNNIINGIKHKIEREQQFGQVHTKDPIKTAVNEQLIFQRMLGHKKDIPGSGQWYESSKNAVACKAHYMNDCYVCEGHVYCIIFWSKGMWYKINPIVNKEKTNEIRFEIDFEFGQQEDGDLMYENTNVKYSQLDDQIPFVCGSFTGWRYRRMFNLEEFNEQFEPREDGFQIACNLGQIRQRIADLSQCNEHETRYVEIANQKEKLRLMYGWRSIFSKNLRYKRPFLMNSYNFYEQPSEDGTLPEDDHMAELAEMGDILSDTSSDDESEVERAPSVQEVKVKMSSLSLEEQEQIKARAEEKRRNPLPIVPDATKFDKIFILPIFIKPGKHHYMVKYKDSQEPRQANLLKKIRKQERRYRSAIDDPDVLIKPFSKQKYREAKTTLVPECFFYHCDVPKRTEEVPIYSKPMKTKVVERSFDRDMSVFKPWRSDTADQITQAFNEDRKQWKLYRFIKSEDERADTEAVLKKFYGPMKDIFYFLASNSSWPNVGQLDVCDFTGKAKILDSAVNISAVDRAYIAATLKVAESTAPSNGLRRFEFFEILVRLANVKYLESKIVKTYNEATEKMIKECVLVHFKPEPWQPFRDQQLWTIDVNDVFQANLDKISFIHKHFKTPTKGFMELADVIEMCTQLSPLGISEKEINFCYGYSHMTIVNEERQWKKYQSLELVEFIELIGRLSHARFKNLSAEAAATDLALKIESVLDDLFIGFGMQRNEVHIEVEEFSESDDDY